ncbi:MAG: universal stress protein [Armatimonadetes bacterium]|nr:universal stress protein [Armatimonadota bacterium]
MFSRALVGVDFSEPSAAVLSCLPRLAPAGLREIVLGHVVYVANTPGLETMLQDWANPQLAREAEKLKAAGFAVTTDIRLGVPAVVLSEMAEAHDVSVIVVGSHGRSALGRVLLGSVSSGVMHQTHRPVLLIRVQICETEAGSSCEAPCSNLFGHILFATDFSYGSKHAFSRLKQIVAATKAKCTLLHVQDKAVMKHQMARLDEFNATDSARLHDLKKELEAVGAAGVDIRIELGSPARLITEHAGTDDHTLVVMSTRGRGALAEVMVGSIAMNVARLSPIPVLFIPAPEQPHAGGSD